MPRGNLETVHPRPLVLSTVYASLDALDYRPALLSCRKHRLDLNIIHNYAPQIFLQNIEKFVRDVDKTDLFNLFLSGLR